jgi:hypothetical protein
LKENLDLDFIKIINKMPKDMKIKGLDEIIMFKLLNAIHIRKSLAEQVAFLKGEDFRINRELLRIQYGKGVVVDRYTNCGDCGQVIVDAQGFGYDNGQVKHSSCMFES